MNVEALVKYGYGNHTEKLPGKDNTQLLTPHKLVGVHA